MMNSLQKPHIGALFSGSLLSVAASVLIGLGMYLVRRIFADSLPVDDYAALYSLTALGVLAAGILRFGTAEALLFVLAGKQDPAGDEGKNFFTGICLWNIAVFSLVTLGAAAFFAAGGGLGRLALPRSVLQLFLPFLFLSAFEALFANTFNAIGAFPRQYGVQLLKTALTVAGAWLAGGVLTRAVLAFEVPLLVIFLVSLVYLRKSFRFEVLRGSWIAGVRANAPRCLWLWLFSFSPLIFSELATATLAGFSTLKEVAFFNIAVPVAMIVRSFYCVAMVFVPFAGAMNNAGDYRNLRRCIYAALAVVTVCGLLLIPVFRCGGVWLVTLLFGERFVSAVPAAFLLSEAMLIAFSGQVNINTLNTLGHERTSALISLAVAAFAVAAYIPLATAHGAVGVAAGSLAAAFLWSLLSGAALLKVIRGRENAR